MSQKIEYVDVGLTMPRQIFEGIDGARGELSWSQFISKVVETVLNAGTRLEVRLVSPTTAVMAMTASERKELENEQ